jgi:Cft2 family RNA processing exonuclease
MAMIPVIRVGLVSAGVQASPDVCDTHSGACTASLSKTLLKELHPNDAKADILPQSVVAVRSRSLIQSSPLPHSVSPVVEIRSPIAAADLNHPRNFTNIFQENANASPGAH